MALTPRPYEDIVNNIVERLLTANPELTDLNESSIIRMLIETYSLELSSVEFNGVYQQIVEVYNSTRLSTATDDDLEELGKIVGVARDTGQQATAIETFMRTTPTGSDFTIPAGTSISTTPDDASELIKFTTDAAGEFLIQIVDEERLFVNGLYQYRLEQRFFESLVLTADISSIPTVLVEDTDYEILEWDADLIDNTAMLTFSDCDTLTGWTYSADAITPTIVTTPAIHAGSAIQFGKSGTTQTYVDYTLTQVAGIDTSTLSPIVHFYIKDQSSLDKISHLDFHFGDSASDYLINTVDDTELVVGWNELKLDTALANLQGAPQVGDIKYFSVRINVDVPGDTFALGDILIDFIYYSTWKNYTGSVISFLGTVNPDNDTNMLSTYNPLSLDIQSTSLAVGSAQNAGINKLDYKVSAISQITSVTNYESAFGGEDEETDEELRVRIGNATTGLGKATVDAITSAVLEFDFVTSAVVEDMPVRNTVDVITFDGVETVYPLSKQVALFDSLTRVSVERTTLNGAIDDSTASIAVVDASDLDNMAGTNNYILIEDEIIEFTGVSTNTLTGCVRGSLGTTATSHIDTTIVGAYLLPTEHYLFTQTSDISLQPDAITDVIVLTDDDITIAYDYRWLGTINVITAGNFTFTDSQNTLIEDKVDEFKAAGINSLTSSPTVVNVNVSANVKIHAGYVFEDVRQAIVANIEDALNDFSIAEDVQLSQIIGAITGVDGVDFTLLVTPSAITSIDITSIAKAGTVVIGEI